LQPEVRRVPVIQLPIVARIPLVRNNEPPAVVQTSPRQPIRHARQAAATCNSSGAGLIPPCPKRNPRLVLDLQQIRPDELLHVSVLCLLVLLQVPRSLDPEILAEQAAQFALGTRPLVARIRAA